MEKLRKDVSRPPPLWASVLVCAGILAVTAYLRLVVFKTETVPVGFGLPLLVCFWARDRHLLYAMALMLSGVACAKTYLLTVDGFQVERDYWLFGAGTRLLDVWVMATVIAVVMRLRAGLETAHAGLTESHERLEESYSELSTREEEIARQNEELQSQTEELEQQTEELRQQGEELAQQNEEYQVLNEELSRRERAMSALLESARSIGGGLSDELFTALCRAALQVLDGHADAVGMLQTGDGELSVRGYYGASDIGLEKQRWRIDQSFAKLVMDRGQTGYIKDLELRPDIVVPQPATGRKLRSLLAAPLRVNNRMTGTLEAFSYEPRDWTQQDFQVLEWAAAHCALILEAAQLQEELEQRRREADQAAERKTRFLAAVSHDVRTPANAIGLLAEYIQQTAEAAPEAQSEIPQLASELRESARSLVSLVTEVLDLARFDSGKVDLQITPFCLGQAIEAELRQLVRVAERQGLRLEVDCTADSPIWINTDRVKLTRVLSNLVDNALKFTEQGSVRVHCGRTQEGLVKLVVEDTGVGIPADQVEHIFDEFYQLRNPARDRSRGTGLGLAICKRLADAMGCRLEVVSEVGRGTTFTLTLPPAAVGPALAACPPAVTSDPAHGGSPANGQALSGLRVLLVEDHAASREITSRLLQAHGAEVIVAADGRTGLHRLTHDNPHVLLLDLMLPDIDGREILRSLLKRRPDQLRCCLAVSGDLTPSRLQEVRMLGADGLVPKPLDFGKLMEAITHRIGARSGSHAAAPSCRSGVE